jgi:hypothetical protein
VNQEPEINKERARLRTKPIAYVVENLGPSGPGAIEIRVGFEWGTLRTFPADPGMEKADLLTAMRGLLTMTHGAEICVEVATEERKRAEYAMRNGWAYMVVQARRPELRRIIAAVEGVRHHTKELTLCSDWSEARLKAEIATAMVEPDVPGSRIEAYDETWPSSIRGESRKCRSTWSSQRRGGWRRAGVLCGERSGLTRRRGCLWTVMR